VYGLFTIVTQLALSKVPGIDVTQTQNLGLSTHLVGGELLAAYIVLVVLTPLFEEFIFRGVLYGELRDHHMTKWPAILIVSALFGVAHGQWNVGVTVFVMSLAMCTLRELTGTIWAGMLVHMIKNGVAFYFLFINPIV
jgi:membrane protease YdiL (CAAX protease family)